MRPGDLASGSTFLWSTPHEDEDVKFLCATFEGECYLIVKILNCDSDTWVQVLHKKILGWGLESDMKVVRTL